MLTEHGGVNACGLGCDLQTHTHFCRGHAPIVRAFADKDPKGAATAMDHHLRTTGRLLLDRAATASGDREAGADLWSKLVGG
jgi:DNA-binding GntR family transcriptional regulator